MSANNILLKLINISKRYPSLDSSNESSFILKDLNFELTEGLSVAVIGPSGSGKSTLLNIIGTIDRPTSGEIFFHGTDVCKMSDSELSLFRNREVGLIFQDHHLLPQCSVLENVLLPTGVPGNGISSKEAEATAQRLLQRVELQHRLNHRPAQLSGGERQRVAVVRALVNTPRLVLADEPTGALDHATATNLGSLLVELNREEGVSLITVTHSNQLAEKMDRIFELRNGALRRCE